MSTSTIERVGKYGVIRFIPDLGRDEPVNVGVVIWVGDDLIVKTIDDPLELARPMAEADRGFLKVALENLKSGIGSGLDAEWRSDPNYLVRLRNELAHELQVSALRPIAVRDLAEDAKATFESFVSLRPAHELKTVFTRSQVVSRVKNALRTVRVEKFFSPLPVRLSKSEDVVSLDLGYKGQTKVHVIQGFTLDTGDEDEIKQEIDAWGFRFEDLWTILPQGSSISAVVQPPKEGKQYLVDRSRRVLEGVKCTYVDSAQQRDLLDLAARMRAAVQLDQPPQAPEGLLQ